MPANFQNTFLELYYFPQDRANLTFFKLYAAQMTTQGSVFYRGGFIGVSSGSVSLTTDQVQRMGLAVRRCLSTGATGLSIDGVVTVSTHDATSIDITLTALSYTQNLTNDEASKLAAAASKYVVTQSPPQPPSGVPTPFDFSL
jgi:uncharacterized membrane protein